jgi:hypothetical protein
MASDNDKDNDLAPRDERNEVPETQPADPQAGDAPSESVAPEEPETLPEDEPRQGWLPYLAARLTRIPEPSRDAKSSERTRGLVILAGASLACLFLFFGLFTTDSSTNRKPQRTTPSLGRPGAAATDLDAPKRSPVPQLSVNQQPSDESGELSEQDLLQTMRNRGVPALEASAPPAPPNPAYALSTVNFQDPALVQAYRRQGLTPPRRTEVAGWSDTSTGKRQSTPPPLPALNSDDELRKSSIVFVRTVPAATAPQTIPMPAMERANGGLLPQGTALVARLQHAVSSAAKVPVTAVIEYNYEDRGQIVVPAGAKAYGELAQATPQGWATIKFHTLEFPNGDQEAISGSALSMERGALRGDVTGKNGGKKFLTRALTGVGTIAAYAVGGRGLSGGVDNSILLRERLASNIALAGEQELAMLAYQQNIVVTVPANTRFYLVLHEPGASRQLEPQVGMAPGRSAGSAVHHSANSSGLSEGELREMVQLRNELREMNRLMRLGTSGPESPSLESR